MRKYILTNNERNIIRKYLKTGEHLEGITVLIHRCKHMTTINNDHKLIKQFLTKLTHNQTNKTSKDNFTAHTST